MERSRRNFLKISGICLLGLGVKPVVHALAKNEQPQILPGPDAMTAKRWAMVVDTKKCVDDCRDCIDACHQTHNVPDFGNPKDEIKWIWHEYYGHAFPGQEHEYEAEEIERKPFMVLCNHCDNPPCVRVCPVQATWKRSDGIVMMDYHRCIGCRCCMAACPYGSRSFNWRDPRPYIKETNPEYPTRTKGVAEKCTFCVERLAVGLMPACVEACKHGALVFGALDEPDSPIREILRSNFTLRRKPELGTRPQVYYIV
ncbi:MAG: 4Fe-4S dicluster domain-containing protein [Candidatus Abyssobacteria bacterium SURF_17]|jgi:molybdopterin-containing oxidoreductase family iron-sulfur binding subunit|uniref:4Fe-4S dicluster domain-containing protein n=1 Tax=Candidatus Abyssobacteria bacterium SURF_17 TaxID=2093361 RepID=A0A419EU45_9BACT|nr:MAG: 4Fe-4S dicluster domain-containing protein [Candidatus Abyssubacteria bacterium SURF_17]